MQNKKHLKVSKKSGIIPGSLIQIVDIKSKGHYFLNIIKVN